MAAKTVLLADDERDILELLSYSLEKEGYKVWSAENGQDAIHLARNKNPDFIILDIMMPQMDGIEVCRKLREDPKFENTYIIILTARGEEYSEVAGFEAGADDYITKPVKIRSLLKRLDALQRRGRVKSSAILEVSPFKIDRDRYLVFKHDVEIKLPRKEFELLYLLAANQNKVVKRKRIFEEVWGRDVIVVDRTIDVHIRRIRERIGNEYIDTVKGVGYKFVVPE